MVRDILKKMKPAELRKYISAHNKVIRANISKEIKEARVAYSQTLKVRRRELKAAREVNAKGKKKPELIELIMNEPLIVKQIKKDQEGVKPKVPSIKITRRINVESDDEEGEKPEPKSSLGPIPKSKVKIRVGPKKKPVPKITITEEKPEKPDGGGAAEPKSSLGPIPKSKVKIRVGPKKESIDDKKIKEKMIKKYKLKVGGKIKFGKSRSGEIVTITKLGEKTVSWRSDETGRNHYSLYRKLDTEIDEKPKAKKESRIQRIRRERKEALEKDKGKIIPQVEKLRPAQRKVFLDYMKLDFEDGFTLEDQLSTFEAFEELADELPTSGGAREKLNDMDIEELKVMSSLYPEVYIKYIEVEKDFTGRKEKIEAQTQKNIDKANKERKKEQAAEPKKKDKPAKKPKN